jgi:hypothetical protein
LTGLFATGTPTPGERNCRLTGPATIGQEEQFVACWLFATEFTGLVLTPSLFDAQLAANINVIPSTFACSAARVISLKKTPDYGVDFVSYNGSMNSRCAEQECVTQAC